MRLAIDRVDAKHLTVVQRERSLEQGRVHLAALAGCLSAKECRSDAKGQGHGAHVVGAHGITRDGPPIFVPPVRYHQTAPGLHDDVHARLQRVWPSLAEGRDIADDKPRVLLTQGRPIQPELLPQSRPEVQ